MAVEEYISCPSGNLKNGRRGGRKRAVLSMMKKY
jgi:hypothetical protein